MTSVTLQYGLDRCSQQVCRSVPWSQAAAVAIRPSCRGGNRSKALCISIWEKEVHARAATLARQTLNVLDLSS
jgi:hypothetical protein